MNSILTDEDLRGLIEVHAMVGAAEACQLAEAVLSARASIANKDAFRDRLAGELEAAGQHIRSMEATFRKLRWRYNTGGNITDDEVALIDAALDAAIFDATPPQTPRRPNEQVERRGLSGKDRVGRWRG